jgi:toxin ParE1/3/4
MVIWTARARSDLKAIHDYIAKDSPQNAKRVVREMHRKASVLAETPHLGRVVPELEDPDIREIPAYSWRSSTNYATPACSYTRTRGAQRG